MGPLGLTVFLPFAILFDLWALLKLTIGLVKLMTGGYQGYFAKLGPREAALANASHGAAMIVLPVLVLLHFSRVLPPWSSLVVLAAMAIGSLRLFKGAKFSAGWCDPELIGRAGVKIALAVFLFRAIDLRQFGHLDPRLYTLLQFVGWWLLVTGLTKLLLVLRGQPYKIPEPVPSHGNAPFVPPNAAAKGLKTK